MAENNREGVTEGTCLGGQVVGLSKPHDVIEEVSRAVRQLQLVGTVVHRLRKWGVARLGTQSGSAAVDDKLGELTVGTGRDNNH